MVDSVARQAKTYYMRDGLKFGLTPDVINVLKTITVNKYEKSIQLTFDNTHPSSQSMMKANEQVRKNAARCNQIKRHHAIARLADLMRG